MIRVRLHLLALLSYCMGSGGLHRWMGQQLCGLARVWEVSYGGGQPPSALSNHARLPWQTCFVTDISSREQGAWSGWPSNLLG